MVTALTELLEYRLNLERWLCTLGRGTIAFPEDTSSNKCYKNVNFGNKYYNNGWKNKFGILHTKITALLLQENNFNKFLTHFTFRSIKLHRWHWYLKQNSSGILIQLVLPERHKNGSYFCSYCIKYRQKTSSNKNDIRIKP